MKKSILILVVFFSLSFVARCHALSIGTHQKINSYIISNMTSFDSTLKKYNLPDGVRTKYEATDPADHVKKLIPINDIIANGGITEDTDPIMYARSFNHFHDPLAPNWTLAGFNWFVPPVSNLYIIASPFFYNGRYYHNSSAVWAQTKSQSFLFGNYSWPDARQYFYL
jgi:hypothetical protein